MGRIKSVPEGEVGLLGRLAYGFSRRRFGKVADPLGVMARHRGVLVGNAAMELALERSDRVEHRLKQLAETKVALLVGCEFCIDIGSMLGRESGVTEEQLRALPRFRESDAFSPLEKLVLEYAAAMTRTPAEIPDGLFAALRGRLGEAALVELTAAIAWENYRARFNDAFGLGPQGFSEGAYCPLPETAVTGAPQGG